MSKGTAGPGFIVLTLLFLGVFYALSKIKNVQDIKKNWETVRCRPDVLFFASIYGHDTAENIQFCLTKIFTSQAGSTVAPFYTYLQMFIGVIAQLLQSINSIRLTFATLVGSITTVMNNFNDRINQMFSRIQMTFIRMKFLMGRLYGTLFAVMYMMLSGMTAVNNFGNTFLFKFLDTFCFDPDTPIEIQGKGTIPISAVCTGDRLATGKRVTATFQFQSDGQEMVRLGNVLVSTNHYVLSNSKWIRADEHPDAIPAEPWAGGVARPLICLNTEDHCIPLGGYTFRDYDESEEGDADTMRAVLAQLNGAANSEPTDSHPLQYTTCIFPFAQIRMKDGSTRSAHKLRLGDATVTGYILGIVKKEVGEVSSQFSMCTPGCAVWDRDTNMWIRAGAAPGGVTVLPEAQEWISFVVEGGQFELEDGTRVRDYVEIHSPDTNIFYEGVLRASAAPNSKTE